MLCAPPLPAVHTMHWPALPAVQVEADKARREDRLSRDPDFDDQQGVERDYVSAVACCCLCCCRWV